MGRIKLLEGLLNSLNATANRLIHYEHEMALPVNPHHDDLYLVSFPKSGATWMNFLCANIHLRMSNINKHVTFFNIHDFVPDIQLTRHLREDSLVFPGCRFIKSHAPYNPYYTKVVYIVRDPRDVLVSYYSFLKGLKSFSGTVSALVHSPVYGIETWCRHVSSWSEMSLPGQSMTFVRYEDLKTDPNQTMKSMYWQLGHEIPDDILNEAVNLSSFGNMKKMEEAFRYGGRDKFGELKFMRSGTVGEGKQQLSASDLEHIAAVAGRWMDRFGYSA